MHDLLLREEDLGFATDLYQLTMMAAYEARMLDGDATFELFVRRLPPDRGFLVAAGLEQALAYVKALRFTKAQIGWLREHPVFAAVDPAFFDYLADFRFDGDIDAVPEGTIVFPNEPLVRV